MRVEDVDVLYRGEQDCEKFRKILPHGRARYAMICVAHWTRVFRRMTRDATGPSGGMADAEVSKTSDFGRVSSTLTSGTIFLIIAADPKLAACPFVAIETCSSI